jgi:hypothetical protein
MAGLAVAPRQTAYPYTTAQTSMADMLNAIMPIMMLVILMAMIMPMMKGVAGAS